jgi:hypothetical protein
VFVNVLRLEAVKVFRPLLLWIGLAGLAVVSGCFFSLYFAFRGNIPPSGTRLLYWPDSLVYGLDQATGFFPATSFGAMLLIVVTGVLTAREYSWRTLRLWLGQGVPRPMLMVAKLLVLLAPAAAIVLACLAVIGGLSAVFSFIDHGSVAIGRVDVAQLALAFGRTLLGTLPYMALTFLLAVAGRSAVGAVGGGLGFVLLETALVVVLPALGRPFARAAAYLPSQLSAALNAPDVALAHGVAVRTAVQPDPAVAAAAIAAYTLVLCGLAVVVVRRQDLC